MAVAGLTAFRAVFGVGGEVGFFEVLEEVIAFRKVVDVFALPVGSCEVAVVFAVFVDENFAVFFG